MRCYDSKPYSTAARQASFVRTPRPCRRNDWRLAKHASQAEQECTLRAAALLGSFGEVMAAEVGASQRVFENGVSSDIRRERFEDRECCNEDRDLV